MKRKPLWVASACRMHTAGVWSPFQMNRLGDGFKPHRLKEECFKIPFRKHQNIGSTVLLMCCASSIPKNDSPISDKWGTQYFPCHVTVLL